MQPSPTPFTTYPSQPTTSSFFILPKKSQEIENFIKNCKVTSPGHDKIDIAVLKKCSNIVSIFLEYIIDKSNCTSCFNNQKR